MVETGFQEKKTWLSPGQWLIPLTLIGVLLIISRDSAALYHTLIEFFSIGASILIFVIAWNTYSFSRNNFFLYLGCGYLWVGFLDLMHTLSYKGVFVYTRDAGQISIEHWISARLLEAFVLVSAPLFLHRPLSKPVAVAGFGAAAILMFTMVMAGGYPEMYIPDVGLTTSKVAIEYLIVLVMGAAIMLLHKQGEHLNPVVKKNIILAIGLMIMAELCFTRYVDPYDIWNKAGHVFKFFSFWVIYTTLVNNTLKDPYLQMAKMASTYDAIPDAIVLVDKAGVIRQANQAAAALIGQPVQNILGRHSHELFHPAKVSREECPVCISLTADSSATDMELKNPATGKWLDVSLSPITLSGTVTGCIEVYRDITERKVAEYALKSGEERFKSTFEQAAIGIVHLSLDRQWLLYNKKFCDIVGYTRVEVAEKSFDSLVYPDDLARCHEYFQGIVLNPSCSVQHDEYRLIRKNGSIAWVNITSSYVEGNQGNYSDYIIVIIEDITKHKNERSQMVKLWGAIKHSDHLIMMTDEAGVIEYVNPAFERITGYRSAEIIGKKSSIMKSGVHDKSFYTKLWTEISKGESFKDVFINRKKDGTLYYEEKTITPLTDSNGKIIHYVSTGADITERTVAQEKLQYLAHHDILTGLPNRSLLKDRIEHAMAQARRADRSVAIHFIDLDRFKDINDSLGHAVGDKLLQLASRRLVSAIRQGDTVSRLGGDEFVIVQEQVKDQDEITGIAKKILDNLTKPFDLGQHEVYVTPSIGITLYPHDGHDFDSLLRNADSAMYQSKAAGGNTYRFFTADMTEKAMQKLEMESRLRHALERNEFVIFYQPKIDLHTAKITGAEALVRWNNPDYGLMAPLQFVPLLEEIGLIVPVSEWIIDSACAQLHQWRQLGLKDLTVSINLSARQFQKPGLLEAVDKAISTYDIRANMLEFEITEGILVDNIDRTATILGSLNEMGAAISIDDFGTGYSSLSYLKKFPVDALKIDRSFIRDITIDHDDAAIARAIIALARSMGLTVVAEGIETMEQLTLLKSHGCNEGQGYYFSVPLAPEAFTAWVRQSNLQLSALAQMKSGTA